MAGFPAKQPRETWSHGVEAAAKGAAADPGELPECPVAAVTSYPKLSGLKQAYYLTVLEVKNPKSVTG